MTVLAALNDAQCEAAQVVDGPVLILAGAGSGKTRVLTHRIAFLIDEIGVRPWNILAVTFTNKAAGEMRERIEGLVGPATRDIWMGTFHSICARLLRYEAGAFDLDPNFTIYDEDDRRALMRRVMKSRNVNEEELTPRAAIAQISRAKNAMKGADDLAREAGDTPQKILMAEIYLEYESQMRQNHAMDFDDLLVVAVRKLGACPEVLSKYQERLRYILVDEYQDTNRPQYLFTRLLADRHRNLCCVGDDDQSIYQFRGADIRNILDFERDYPEAKIVRLEQNYRSSGRILEVANAVISNNQGRKGKNLWTDRDQGDRVQVVECDTDRSEARYVVDTIQRVRAQGLDLADAAVLYRTNAQSRVFEEELQRSAIPYVIIGGVRFYERREIKDFLAYLRLLVNPSDDVSLLRVINMPRRGIGTTSIQRLQTHARQTGATLFATLADLDHVVDLSTRTVKPLRAFHQFVTELTERQSELELPALAEETLNQSGYRQMLRDEGTPEAEVREQNLDQLLAFIAEFSNASENPDLSAFLEETALLSPVDEMDDTEQGLTMMTLHTAKGLEFPLIFICGLEEQLFPTARSIEESFANPQALEEERRLLYVGITRARRFLHLTHAGSRFSYGSLQYTVPSRFIGELPAEHIETSTANGSQASTSPPRRLPGRRKQFGSDARWSHPQQVRKQGAPDTLGSREKEGVHYEWDESPSIEQIDTGDAGDDFLARGSWVLHPTWGRGQIVQRDGHGTDMKLSIRFGNNQVKKVAVAYAQLEPA